MKSPCAMRWPCLLSGDLLPGDIGQKMASVGRRWYVDNARGMFGGNNQSRQSAKVSQDEPLFFSAGSAILPSRA